MQNDHSITFPLKQEVCEVTDLALLNVSLTFPAAGLMKQCQIRDDIENRRTSGDGDCLLSVCSVCVT